MKNIIEKIKIFFSKKGTKKGTNSILSAIILLIILGVLNYIVNKHEWKYDFTANKINMLSKQSEAVLKKLDKKIKIIGFLKDGVAPMFDKALEKYKYYTDKIETEVIDPNTDPIKARKYNVTKPGVFIVVSDVGEARFQEDPKRGL